MSRMQANATQAVTVTTSSTAIVSADPGRREITIVNDGANIVYLALQSSGSAPTAVANSGIRLNASGGSYTTNLFEGAIAGIALTASCVVTVANF